MKTKPFFFFAISSLFGVLLFLNLVNANPLQNHSSPYLAMHGKDPVNWMEWGKPALDKAKKENKLLFVSIGYFACHWCHVMHKESYSNQEIADKLNKNYISVKIDRELNPVLDKRLIEFVQTTNGTAGWPLNVFITPEGYPLVGATYMPKEHFSSVLDQLSKKWKNQQFSLANQAKSMSKTLVSLLAKQELKVSTSNIKTLREKYVEKALQYADTMQGGFGQQRKFPQIPQLWAMLKLNKTSKNTKADEFIQLTLNQMMQKGLHDDVAGGFYRYTTDPDWEIPHYEKMLYTNAMAPLLYFDAAKHYNNESYNQVALETLKFLQNEMRGSANAFITSLSAVDDKGEEGGYYLWQQAELKKVLSSEELKTANLYWKMNRPNEKPAGNLPRQQYSYAELAKKINKNTADAISQVEQIRKKLKAHRNKTRKIPRDTKLLAGMNGLTLAAFAEAIRVNPNDKSLQVTGQKLSEFLIALWNEKKLRRSAANAKQGTLYDYAAVSWGLLKWGIASNNSKIKQVGIQIANTAWDRFYINNSWLENPDSLLPKGVQQAHISDSSLISAEALLLEASLISKVPALQKKAQQLFKNITRSVETDVFGFASFLSVSN